MTKLYEQLNAYEYLCYGYYHVRFSGKRRATLSKYLSKRQQSSENTTLRHEFRTTNFPEVRPTKNHSHPTAAGNRNNVSLFAITLAGKLGVVPFMWQRSVADLKKGLLGNREFYWDKDIAQEPCDAKPPRRSLVTIVDTDFYMDMPAHLVKHVRPTLIYTYEPTVACGRVSDGEFWFEKDEFSMRAAGGAQFRHQLWDYSPDIFSVFGHFKLRDDDEFVSSCLGSLNPLNERARMVTYCVERRKVGVHRILVFLVPFAVYEGAAAIVAWTQLAHRTLERMNPSCGDFTVIRNVESDSKTSTVSVARHGTMACATIPTTTFDVLQGVARECHDRGKILQTATVESYLPSGDPDKRLTAQVLKDYMQSPILGRGLYVFPVEYAITPYQYAPETYDDEAENGLAPFMAPIFGAAASPDLCLANDVQCIDARVKKVATPPMEISPFLRMAMSDFAQAVVPETIRGRVCPVDVDDVYERQARPMQRQILDQAGFLGPFPNVLVKCFQKREAYGKITDPRNISTIPGCEKLSYSRYTYAATNVVKEHRWYAFSRTPLEIARCVASICEDSEHVVLGDFSKMDGHVSNVGRELTATIMLLMFSPTYHDELRSLLGTQYNKIARTPFGVKFETLTSRLSGSPETSLFNTLENAFIAYLAVRSTRKSTGSFYSHDEAWDWICKLCIFGGDDSLMGNLKPEKYAQAAAKLGHVVKSDVIQRGGSGVNFLSRFFSPEVWYGCPDSCCDILRQGYKFHLSGSLPAGVTPRMKLVEKSRSMLLTDGNTPLIGDIVRRVVSLGRAVKHIQSDDVSWWSQYDLTTQFPNENVGGWMNEFLRRQLPEYCLDALQDWIEKTKHIDELLAIPLFQLELTVPPTQVGVVVGGENAHVEEIVDEGGVEETKEEDPETLAEEKADEPSKPVMPKTKETKSGEVGEKKAVGPSGLKQPKKTNLTKSKRAVPHKQGDGAGGSNSKPQGGAKKEVRKKGKLPRKRGGRGGKARGAKAPQA